MHTLKTPSLVALFLAVAAAASAGTREIRLQLRVPPELQLKGTERIYVGPILLEPQRAEATRRVDIAAVRELDHNVRWMLRRQTRLNVLPPEEGLRPPTSDILELKGLTEFWRELGQRTGADFVFSASLDVEILDRAGYTTEKYVSPEDGKTYFRQVLVEETGFKYDILIMVFDGSSGELVHEEQISDFKERQERKLDEYKDMFDDLYTLENRLLGIFVPRMVQAKRYLYTD